MAQIKNPEADLRLTYKKVIEICVIISLVLLIAAFKFFPFENSNDRLAQDTQELFKAEDIQQTKQVKRPPPPPKPPIPIEAPSDDENLEDIDIASTDLDVDAIVEAPPPPKAKIVDDDHFFVAVEQMPAPIGGIAAIQKKIKYTELAIRAGIEGKVYVLAYVNKKGIVTKVSIIKGLGAGLDQSALNAVRTTRFRPGKQRGKPVNVQVSLRIVFSLRN